MNKAFTLVEVMIVVVIIGLLAAVAIQTLPKARDHNQGVRKYTIIVRHAGEPNETFYVDTYEATNGGVWFIDSDGKRHNVTGDVSVTEN